MAVLHKIRDFERDARAIAGLGQKRELGPALRRFLAVIADRAHSPVVGALRDRQSNLVAGDRAVVNHRLAEELVAGNADVVAANVLHLAPGKGDSPLPGAEGDLRRRRVDQHWRRDLLGLDHLIAFGWEAQLLIGANFFFFFAAHHLAKTLFHHDRMFVIAGIVHDLGRTVRGDAGHRSSYTHLRLGTWTDA